MVIGPEVTVGRGCKVQNNVSVYQGVTLEDDVFCDPFMVFTNVFNPRAHIRRMDGVRPTLVKTYAFVGAGAVVTKAVPDHALVVGNPARRIGWRCEYGNKLDEQLQCVACEQRLEETARA